MAFVKTTWNDDALPDIRAAQLNRIEQGIADLHNRPLVNALPTVGVVDGDEVYYLADTTPSFGGPYIWHLRYRAAATSASKWEVVAPPLELRHLLQAQVTTNTNVKSLADGPAVTVPLPGDYDVLYSCVIGADKSTDSQPVVGIVKNVVGTSLSEDIAPISPVGSATYGWTGEQSGSARVTLAAGDVVRMSYRSFTATVVGFSVRQIRIRPIRVGP